MAKKLWLQLCKLLYQLTESCGIQEEGLQIKVSAHQPLLLPLEKMLALLIKIDDPIQHNQVSEQACWPWVFQATLGERQLFFYSDHNTKPGIFQDCHYLRQFRDYNIHSTNETPSLWYLSRFILACS